MNGPTILCLLTAARAVLGQAGDSGWLNTVRNSVAFRQMPPSAACAQTCITNVDAVTGCTVYSCVCSGNTGGSNYVAGRDYITACAHEKCPDPAVADIAKDVFNQICSEANSLTMAPSNTGSVAGFTTRTSVTSPASTSSLTLAKTAFLLITGGKYPHRYDNLHLCSKFVLNGCRDATLAKTEKDCEQIHYPQDRGEWYGVGNATGCSDAKCLCQTGPNSATGYFNVTFHAIFDAGVDYCSLAPTLSEEHRSPEFESLMGVVAHFCAVNGFPADGWYLPVPVESVMPPSGSNGTAGNGTNSGKEDEKFSKAEVITMATSIPIAGVALLSQLVALVMMWPGWKKAKQDWKEMRAQGLIDGPSTSSSSGRSSGASAK